MFRGRLGFTPFETDQKIGIYISSVARSLETIRVRTRDSDQKPKIMEEKYGGGSKSVKPGLIDSFPRGCRRESWCDDWQIFCS